MHTDLDLMLHAGQQTATARVYYTARGRHSAGLDIQLNGNYDFDSRTRALIHERCNRFRHYLSALVPKLRQPPSYARDNAYIDKG